MPSVVKFLMKACHLRWNSSRKHSACSETPCHLR